MKKSNTKTLITILFTCFFLNFHFSQNNYKESSNLPDNYYNINKIQKDIAEFYLLAKYYYPNGEIRSFNKMYWLTPDLIAIDKDGKILDFDSFKTVYRDAGENKKKFSVNLFYLDFKRNIKNNELVMSYTVLEPNWEDVIEVKEFEYKKKCPTGCEELYELPIRKIHRPIKFKKFNQNIIIYYMNDYE